MKLERELLATGPSIVAMEPGVARARLDFHAAERFLPLRRQVGVTAFGLNQLVLRPALPGDLPPGKLAG